MKYFYSLFFFLLTLNFYAQTSYIKGTVTDNKTKETLIGVKVMVDDTLGTITDINGNYSIQCNSGIHKIEFSYTGYKTILQQIEVKFNFVQNLSIALENDSKLLDVVVVSAGKFEQNIGEVTVSMDVIKPRLIENKGIQSIDNAMEFVPGVNIIGGQANIRGGAGYSYGAGSRVLLVVDDMPMLSADAGDIKWSFLPIENIEQIEVIKGASSALFGSSAMNGVIHLRTAYAKDEPITKLDFYAAMFDKPKRKEIVWWTGSNPTSTSMSFSHSQKIKNLDLVIGGNAYNNDGYKKYTKSQRYRFNGNLRYRFKKIHGLSAGVNYNIQKTYGATFLLWQNPDSALIPAGGEIAQTEILRSAVDPFITYHSKNNSKHTLRNRFFRTQNISSKSANSSTSYLLYSEYQYQKRFEKNLTLTSGLVYTYIEVPTSGLYGVRSSTNAAVYAQIDKKVKKLSLSFGIRGEYFKTDTTETKENINLFFDKSKPIIKNSPIKPVMRAGLNYQLLEYTYVRSSFGQGYRFPSISERFIKTNSEAVIVYPNDSLLPESGWTAEIGIKQGIAISNWKGYIDLTGFISEYQDMVEFTFGQFGDPLVDPQYGTGFQAQNIGNTRIMGFEISLMGQGHIGNVEINTLMGYTYIDPRQKDFIDSIDAKFSTTGTNLLKYRYEHTGKADIEFTYKKISTGFSMRANSYMRNIDIYLEDAYYFPGMKAYREKHNKGDTNFDFRIAYKIDKKVKLSFIVNNIFNREIMGRPADLLAPRNFALQLNVRL